MIKKSLFLRESACSIPLINPDVSNNASPLADFLSKTTQRWNQADHDYFDPYLNNVHGNRKIVLFGKKVYYRKVVLFV